MEAARDNFGEDRTDPTRLLRALRQGDAAQKDAAMLALHRRLQRQAGRYLGDQAEQADLQVESIVQSVIVGALADGFDGYNDDAHLRAGLHQRVRHLILDRKKKHRPGALPRGEEDETLDPTAAGPGPGTQVARREDEKNARRQRQAFIDMCLAAPITERQRKLLAPYLDGRSWQEIATTLESTVGAAKKMMSEMRPKVLAHLLEPLRTKVDGRCWGLIELHFIKRRSIETAASAMGMDVEAAKRAIESEIQVSIFDHIGGTGVLPLFERLLGYRKE